MKVGRVDIEPVLDGSILSGLPASKALPEPGSARWADQHGMFRADGLVESTLGGFLIRAGERLALVDAGGGQAFANGYSPPVIDVDDPEDPIVATLRARNLSNEMISLAAAELSRVRIEQGRLPTSLAELGVCADDVTDLIFTHLHFDHIGWASAGGSAFFPNATIRCAAADLDYFIAGPDEEHYVTLVFRALSARERLDPVLDRVETWERDGPLFPGVDVRLAPGHTPGSSVVVVSDGPARAMLLGDMVHCPLELTDEDFNLLVDHDQVLANRVREAYARELENTDVMASAAHFPGLSFGRLLAGEAARRWTFS
jgi:glyoxylase-like metal-dependent hydrolase (beta-lactamase superfamily II)